MKEQDPKVLEIEVKGNTRPLQVNDPVLFVKDNIHYKGKIESFEKNGDTKLIINNIKDLKELIVPKGAEIEPLFSIDKNEKMVYLKYSYSEVAAALSNKSEIKANFPEEKNPFFNLMLGNKTEVLKFEKKIDDKMALVEGRLQIKKMKDTQMPYLSADVKFKELNLDRPIYGKSLDVEQKERLLKTGELGLVGGFKTAKGDEYSLWVSLDSKLNKVVTARENDIYIGKFFGVTPNEKQLQEIKSGVGTIIEVNNKNYFMQASAATTKADGIKSYTEEKAREFKLIPEQKEEKKNDKSKGLKMK